MKRLGDRGRRFQDKCEAELGNEQKSKGIASKSTAIRRIDQGATKKPGRQNANTLYGKKVCNREDSWFSTSASRRIQSKDRSMLSQVIRHAESPYRQLFRCSKIQAPRSQSVEPRAVSVVVEG